MYLTTRFSLVAAKRQVGTLRSLASDIIAVLPRDFPDQKPSLELALKYHKEILFIKRRLKRESSAVLALDEDALPTHQLQYCMRVGTQVARTVGSFVVDGLSQLWYEPTEGMTMQTLRNMVEVDLNNVAEDWERSILG